MIEIKQASGSHYRLSYDGMNYVVETLKRNVNPDSKNFGKDMTYATAYFSGAKAMARKIVDEELGLAIEQGVDDLGSYIQSIIEDVKKG